MLREGARLEIVGNILGHVDSRVTQNVDRKSWWKGFPDEPETRLRKAVTVQWIKIKSDFIEWPGAIAGAQPSKNRT
jgi:hypothetical protein